MNFLKWFLSMEGQKSIIKDERKSYRFVTESLRTISFSLRNLVYDFPHP